MSQSSETEPGYDQFTATHNSMLCYAVHYGESIIRSDLAYAERGVDVPALIPLTRGSVGWSDGCVSHGQTSWIQVPLRAVQLFSLKLAVHLDCLHLPCLAVYNTCTDVPTCAHSSP